MGDLPNNQSVNFKNVKQSYMDPNRVSNNETANFIDYRASQNVVDSNILKEPSFAKSTGGDSSNKSSGIQTSQTSKKM